MAGCADLTWVALHGSGVWTRKKADICRAVFVSLSWCVIEEYQGLIRHNTGTVHHSWKRWRSRTDHFRQSDEGSSDILDIVRARNLCAIILHGRVDGSECRGRTRKRWTDDILEWTSMSMVDCIQSAECLGELLCNLLWSLILSNDEGRRRRHQPVTCWNGWTICKCSPISVHHAATLIKTKALALNQTAAISV